MHIEHINITGPWELLEAVKTFYVEALGLHEGFRPPVSSRGYWLYSDDVPVVHLNEQEGRSAPPPANYFDHVAFACSDLEAVIARLEHCNVEHRVHHYPEVNFTQIFLRDPAGTGIELNFR